MSFKIGFGLGAGIMVGMIAGMILAGACAAAGFGGYMAVKNKLHGLKKRKESAA